MLFENYLVILPILFCGVDNVKVKVKQGIILGTKEVTVFNGKQYYAFYGIPYARAPIGKLRFKNPKPIKEWTKPLDATIEYRGACAQAHIVHKHGVYGFEDCLFLNIYTPHLPTKETQILRAVIVWIHGYAFTSSFSHIHGADFLIDNDVVLISLTHRVGAFGFLKLNETDRNVNMGLEDIITGLKWIKTNIHSFGGNEKNITLMGSGSASTLISLLMITKYRKLFSKIILQSGSMFSPALFPRNYEIENQRLIKELNKLNIGNINSAKTQQIIQASKKIYTSRDIINFQRSIIPFTPHIETAKLVFENLNISKIPIIIGFTSQESISEVIPFIHNNKYLKFFQSHFKFMVPFENGFKYEYSSEIYKRISKEIKTWYFKNGISENSIDDFLYYVSDLHKYPIYKFIQLLLSVGSEIYVYKFDYVGKFNAVKSTSLAGSNIKVKGAAQGDEVCYILKCDPLWESYVKLRENKYDRDRIFIENITQMWANFAKFGEPTSIKAFGNITWRPMTLKEDNILHFAKRTKLINSKPEREMFLFWKRIYETYYDPSLKQIQFKDDL